MSESKHTGGTWRANPGNQHYGSIVSDVPVEGRTARGDEVAFYGGHLIAESVMECNRPIIAAAPDLYAALEDAIESLEAARCCPGLEPNVDDWARDSIAGAKAALSKARGEDVGQ